MPGTPVLPFTWPRFEREIGKKLPDEAKARITRLAGNPTAETWVAARTIVVAPHLSITGMTLWQCAEAVTLRRYPDGEVPDQGAVILALCFAAGIPAPQEVRR
jgi:protein-disulfide isomerase-like protein with CxxC motif